MKITSEMIKTAIKKCWDDYYDYNTEVQPDLDEIILKLEELYKDNDDLTEQEETQVWNIMNEEIERGEITFQTKNIYSLKE